ncbi:MAG: glutaminyl-peptide cyclotransferase [Candidatus Bathyarchaeota archaeon]
MKMDQRIAVALVIMLSVAALYTYQNLNQEPKLESFYTYRVVKKYPHDPGASTQGLVIHNGVLYEGTGLYGGSSIRIVEQETGEILRKVDLSQSFFGEGVTILNNKVYQVTWREHTGFVYDLELNGESTFSIPNEGWGLTENSTHLILSDGTSTLSFIDPQTMKIVETVIATYEEDEVGLLNELEYIEGKVYANIWQTDNIAVIDPSTGNVVSWIDLTGLQNELNSTRGIDVLNGIAYNRETGKIYVTGKQWPNLFEIQLIPK